MHEKYPGPVRLGAAKTVLDRTGYVENPNKANGSDKQLAEMTESELLSLAAKMRAQRTAPTLDSAEFSAEAPAQAAE